MSVEVTTSDRGIDLKGVPVNFRGGLATGAAILVALLFEAGASEEDVTEFLRDYHEKAQEVIAQIEPQVAAQKALLSASVEGVA